MSYLLISLLASFTALAVLCAFLAWRRRIIGPGTGRGPSRSGGLAMALALGGTGLLAATYPIGSSQVPAAGITPALTGALLVFLIGWIDDLRPLPPVVKLLGQIGAAILSYNLGLRAGFIPDGPLDQAFTIFCLVGGANALNLIDGMDGLAASLAAVAATTFFFLARDWGRVDAAALAAGLAGCSLGFLWLNLPPARAYMGDAGSNLLGFGLASVPLLVSNGPEGFGDFSVSILLLAVPIADTATTILRRVMRRRSPLRGDLDHIHHRLLRQGWSQGAVIALLAGTTLLIALLVRFGHAIAVASGGRTIAAWVALMSLIVVSSIDIVAGRSGKTPPSIEDKRKI